MTTLTWSSDAGLALEKLLRRGHTVFRNGWHGDGWLEKGEVVRWPGQLDVLAQQQAAQIGAAFGQASLLVGGSQCGAVLAAFVARQVGLPVAFCTLIDGALHLHRMHQPARGQRAVVVDDLISSGRDARATVQGLQALGHEVLGISAWTVIRTASNSVGLRESVATLLHLPQHVFFATHSVRVKSSRFNRKWYQTSGQAAACARSELVACPLSNLFGCQLPAVPSWRGCALVGCPRVIPIFTN